MVSVCVLMISNPSRVYSEMKRIQRNYVDTLFQRQVDSSYYYLNCPTIGFRFYFLEFRSSQTEPIVEDTSENILYIRGEESYVPGILDKTIQGIEYVIGKYSPDYIIRSNLSTILDYPRWLSMLETGTFPKENVYASPFFMELQWTDPAFGIHDTSLFGLPFGCGACILLTSDIASYLVEEYHRGTLNRTIVDDVSIGKLLYDAYCSHPKVLSISYVKIEPSLRIHSCSDIELDSILLEKTEKGVCLKPYVAYRCRVQNRYLDIGIMMYICDRLLSQYVV